MYLHTWFFIYIDTGNPDKGRKGRNNRIINIIIVIDWPGLAWSGQTLICHKNDLAETTRNTNQKTTQNKNKTKTNDPKRTIWPWPRWRSGIWLGYDWDMSQFCIWSGSFWAFVGRFGFWFKMFAKRSWIYFVAVASSPARLLATALFLPSPEVCVMAQKSSTTPIP